MSPEIIAGLIGAFIILVTFVAMIIRKMPKRLKSGHYIRRWREIQRMCRNKEDWSSAIIHADMLLDQALIKKKVAGKTMGERLVNVERDFTAKETVWTAHKLAGNLRDNGDKQLKESKVKDTLIAFRLALRDIGAIK